ncbi:hypothetical protein PRZ48_008917 [Zasmidium cellare]|uniref:Uncharacterized protein n=1 Tax=Zasmidium cellare TaxID=395010 RepID=A0ABR0EGY6_ZASCE|nr:hypothetical protein PRZ48_008917 [Zasmidium cellare]
MCGRLVCHIPADITDAIFDEAKVPSELIIHVHHFRSKKGEVKFPVEMVNTEEWEDMLEIQAINEINEEIIEEALAKKHLVIKFRIVTHPVQVAVWQKDSSLAPELDGCIEDWELFLQKFPFRRMVTTVPYLLRKLNSPSSKSFVEELHYLQLTYDLPAPCSSKNACDVAAKVNTVPCKVDAMLSIIEAVASLAVAERSDGPEAKVTVLDDRCASILLADIEKQFSRAAKYLPAQEMSAEFMGRLAMSETLKSKKYQLSGWETGVIVASGIGETMSGSRYRKDAEGGVTLLGDVVWDKI